MKFGLNDLISQMKEVAPLAGAWVEISLEGVFVAVGIVVAPLAGAWVEIVPATVPDISKFVAPLAGAWVEIFKIIYLLPEVPVAPLAGAWVEIIEPMGTKVAKKSLPSRERGLKFRIHHSKHLLSLVAPLAGAWVEI